MAAQLILLTGLGHHLEGVDIEESLPIERHAGEDAVIQRALHHVGIFAALLEGEHAPGEEDEADGGAGFGINGIVRQVIVIGEGLAIV